MTFDAQVAICTVNARSGQFLNLMVNCVTLFNPGLNVEFFIFDNGSTDGSLDFSTGQEHIQVFRDPSVPCHGSEGHGAAMDWLLHRHEVSRKDVVVLIDPDCFSFSPNWLRQYVDQLSTEKLDALGATAYCPTVCEENCYLWPGFCMFSARGVRYIRERALSFRPGIVRSKVQDTGQIISNAMILDNRSLRFLPRTPPASVGSVPMEKWSIDRTVHHFFAATPPNDFLGYFRYIYGDKSRGRYFAKAIKKLMFFSQPDIRAVLRGRATSPSIRFS